MEQQHCLLYVTCGLHSCFYSLRRELLLLLLLLESEVGGVCPVRMLPCDLWRDLYNIIGLQQARDINITVSRPGCGRRLPVAHVDLQQGSGQTSWQWALM